MAHSKQYVLLPREGLFGSSFLAGLPKPVTLYSPVSAFARGIQIDIIDSIAEDGPKLVKMDEATAILLNQSPDDVIAVPLVQYHSPGSKRRSTGGAAAFGSPAGFAAMPQPWPELTKPADARTVPVTVKERGTSKLIGSANVVGVSDLARREGDKAVSDGNGLANLQLPGQRIELLYCEPPLGYWGRFIKNVPVQPDPVVELDPVTLDFVDCVRRYYSQSRFDKTTPVTVGVIDSGVWPHRDLNLVGSKNLVKGETLDILLTENSHGTHVAGLIGSCGNPPNGLRGVAPGVNIISYRVFDAEGDANAHTIALAIDQAGKDHCDIVNLSIEDGVYDLYLKRAIKHARDRGMLVVVAAGNDNQKPVNYPAAYPGATAVSAMGHEGTLPKGALEGAYIVKPPFSGLDPKEFIAGFSNVGKEIQVTAPGVGVLSTLPNDLYGQCSGTSMAAPVVSGAAASLLSQNPAIYHRPRDSGRSQAIETLLLQSCTFRGFGKEFEGAGMPDPSKV